MKKLTIQRLKTKEITTSRGAAKVHNFQDVFEGLWYSSFVGSWNDGWKNGQTIEVADVQIKINEKDGKTYRNINAPPKSAQARDSADGRVIKALEEIWRDLQKIKKALKIE